MSKNLAGLLISFAVLQIAPAAGVTIEINANAMLEVVNADKGYDGATDECVQLGGKLASFAMAPTELKSFACNNGETWILDNSEGSNDVVLDQSSYGSPENPAHSTAICDGYCKGCARSTEQKSYACCVGTSCSDFPGDTNGWTSSADENGDDENGDNEQVTSVTIDATTDLKLVEGAVKSHEEAVAGCSTLGGTLASFAMAPTELKSFACDHGETWILDNSEDSNDVVLDQSYAGSPENPAHSTAICDGYCKGCAGSTEQKSYACCVGTSCSDFPGDTKGYSGSSSATSGARCSAVLFAVLPFLHLNMLHWC